MSLLHRLEPLFWLLFAAGGALAVTFLPGLFFCIAIAAPLGWIPPDAIAHHRLHALVSSSIGGPLLATVISLVFWHGAHHLRHFALDVGLSQAQVPISTVLYGLALLGTVAAFATVAGL